MIWLPLLTFAILVFHVNHGRVECALTDLEVVDTAELFRKLLLEVGPDASRKEEIILEKSLSITLDDRLRIREQVKAAYGWDLRKEMYIYLHRPLAQLYRGLYSSPEEFMAYEIFKAVDGMGTDEDALNDILCCLNQTGNQRLKDVFPSHYNLEDFTDFILDDVSSCYGELLEALISSERREGKDSKYVYASTTTILKYGSGVQHRKSEHDFFKILSESSFEELKAIQESYLKHTEGKQSVIARIHAERSSNVEDLMQQILLYSMDEARYYAYRIYIGFHAAYFYRNPKAVVRTIILNFENKKLMRGIRDEYKEMTDRDLMEEVKSFYSGLMLSTLLRMLAD